MRPVATACHSLAATALTLSAAAAAVGVSAPSATVPTVRVSADPVKIMVVGDSISHGSRGDATWRYFADKELTRQGVKHEFVGPHAGPAVSKSVTTYSASDYLWPFQGRHAALGGSRYDDHLSVIESRMLTYTPDVVVVGLGWNDISAGESAERVRDEAVLLVQKIRSVNPKVRLVIGEITPRAKNNVRHERTLKANRLIRSAFALDSSVSFNETTSTTGMKWNPKRHTWDNTHPNLYGQALLGYRYNQALHIAGVLPSKPAPFKAPGKWKVRGGVKASKIAVAAAKSGTRLKVTVPDYSGRVRYSRVRVAVVNTSTRTKVVRTVRARAATTIALPVSSGQNLVRVTLQRGSTKFAPGPLQKQRVR